MFLKGYKNDICNVLSSIEKVHYQFSQWDPTCWLYCALYTFVSFFKSLEKLNVLGGCQPRSLAFSGIQNRIESRTLSPHLLWVGGEWGGGGLHESSPRAGGSGASLEPHVVLPMHIPVLEVRDLCSLDPYGPKDRAGTCGAFLPRPAALELSPRGGRSRACREAWPRAN